MSLIRSSRFVRLLLLVFAAGLLTGWGLAPPASQATSGGWYFRSTGQHLDDQFGFLSAWQRLNGPVVLGPPISAVIEEAHGPSQYFERGRLEWHRNLEGTPVLLGRVADEYRQILWLRFPAAVAQEPSAEIDYFAETNQSLAEPFRSFWQAHGGVQTFGFPISSAYSEFLGGEMVRVQYFERARLEYRPLLASVTIAPLGRELAQLRGVSLAPSNQGLATPVDDLGMELAPAATATPLPQPTQAPATPRPAATAAPAAAPVAAPVAASTRYQKQIIVDISDQWLYALEGDRVVFDAPVSTGRDGFNTPIGTFAIYHKTPLQTMRGCAGGECWNVPNVPHAMYIIGGVAIHGTYWHNNFGTGIRQSHGCINLPLRAAEWLYGWAGMGTPVTVRW